MFILEAGTNHLGRADECRKIMHFFQNSTFKKLTFMCQTLKWYNKKIRKKQNFKLKNSFYKRILSIAHKKNKKIGLSVCDLKTYNELKPLRFDFYKLLSIAINNTELINELKKTNKTIYISTGFNSKINQIRKCIKDFKGYKKIILLHTPMVNKYNKLNFRKIFQLKKKFNLDVGYSNHFHDPNTINMLSNYNPKVIMLYLKCSNSKNIKYPDNKHAIYIKDLEKLKERYVNLKKCH